MNVRANHAKNIKISTHYLKRCDFRFGKSIESKKYENVLRNKNHNRRDGWLLRSVCVKN